MFDHCELKEKKCSFASQDGFCGLAIQINKITELNSCPLKSNKVNKKYGNNKKRRWLAKDRIKHHFTLYNYNDI